MTPQLVLASGSLGPVAFEERLAAAAAGGFDAIGLSVREYRRLRDAGCGIGQMRAGLDRHGLHLAELEVLVGFGRVPPTAPPLGIAYSDATTEADFFLMAEAFGARHLQVIGAFSDVLEDDAASAFAGVCDRAAEVGLLVALEFVPTTSVPDAGTATRIVARADRPNGGICVDSWHHFRGLADDGLLAGLPADRVVMVQLDDGPLVPADPDFLTDTTRNRLPPGDGEFDLTHFLQLLWRSGVEAPISVEVLSTDLRTRDPLDVGVLLGDATRRVLAAAGGPHRT